MSRDSAIMPPGQQAPALRSLVMLDDGELQLSLAMFDALAWRAARASSAIGTIEFADGMTRLYFLRADQVEVQLCYRDPANLGPIRSERHQRISSGKQFLLDNATQVLRFTDIAGECVVLRLLIRDPRQRHAVQVDAVSGTVKRVRQARSHDGRLQMTLSLLRSLECKAALTFVSERIANWPAELRWHAVCEMLALDARGGFVLLDAMGRSDPEETLRVLASDTRLRLLVAHAELGGTA